MRIRQTTAHPPASPGPSPSPAQPQTPTAHPQILPYNLDNASVKNMSTKAIQISTKEKLFA